MQPPAVGVEVGHDFKGRDLHIESLGVLQVVVPNLVNNVEEEFCNTTFSCFVAGLRQDLWVALAQTRIMVVALLAMFLS